MAKRIEQLESQLKQNSQNSSKPALRSPSAVVRVCPRAAGQSHDAVKAYSKEQTPNRAGWRDFYYLAL
jgi:hypothetical protein